ncbi:MAG TPA: maltose alpha-D-glucosyltransferase [Candidatus Dormibacteraeota bacterium]|nr:maltose alpha-D-glucosyltransferase [Candidatus Dormibacteraeota bacterium]
MAKLRGSAADPLWYKDAIIYELHVRAFKDSNGDGIGDFPGLLQKLDYLQDLGVTCLWILPFFPSPLKDDGYDISDYIGVHPMYGTIEDFQAFLNAAHDRELQVVIELVINHTSEQHPWFQTARNAPAGSPERDFYVWSDTDQKYGDARIIFTDTEKSNWTWDPVAKAYYWHRFFSHQPDLNYDNPRVVEEVVKVMRYWLDMGVDALRVDAIPYLVEREGTSCENLPETHAIIKTLRRQIDENYSGRMLLAEANQWPTDVRPYFGDGDECHMAFHFPLMPRIYMALRQEDRLPITDIIAQTPSIPESCQWGLFLRNHDELTLEMVTNDERDYMYLAYSADPRMRINLGIRRRLAPLVDNNRRRIELLVSLLFSFPGSPILYYGDEIGMGDNIYLGDRNGVRTPMQWNGDRNAGFSSATPARLYSPVIMDQVWGYEAINVEAQQSDPSSLLNWMRNMVALRKLFRVFGRGSIEFLDSTNRKVLAYLRTDGNEQILCVANLSRFAQPVDLDLSKLEGMVPIEMLGYVEFPPLGQQPYRLTLAPYGFLWLELHPKPEASAVGVDLMEHSPLIFTGAWESIFEGVERRRFETGFLIEYLPAQRWFAAKSRQVKSTRILDWAVLEPSKSALSLVEVQYSSGAPDTYLLPLGVTLGERGEELRRTAPSTVIASVMTQETSGLIHDATSDDASCAALLSLIESGGEISSRHGSIRGVRSTAFQDVLGNAETPLHVRRGSAEQSNTSILFGDRFILKLFRRQEAGANPDCEIGRYLTETVGFDHIPPFAGSIEYMPAGEGEPATLAILQGLVTNEGDGWKWTIEELDRYFEMCAPLPLPEVLSAELGNPADLAESQPSQLARDHVGLYLEAAAALGRRTAELHLALASPTDNPAFSPEPLSAGDLQTLLTDVRQHALNVFDILKERVPYLSDDVIEIAAPVFSQRRRILQRLETLRSYSLRAQRIRIHGDYHLGQVLRVKTDFVILDFEGEPARSLAYRRSKQNPLKDVAGMLRSFSYAAYASLTGYIARHPGDFASLEPWAHLWERSVSGEFLRAYQQTIGSAEFVPEGNEDFRALLNMFLLDKALYEVLYELNSRPDWIRIPLLGIISLL